jgi:hypothetical protein
MTHDYQERGRAGIEKSIPVCISKRKTNSENYRATLQGKIIFLMHDSLRLISISNFLI